MEILKASKILVIQTAFIGDAILTLPMIQELKKKKPGSKIDVLAIPASAEIFDNSPSVNKVIIYDKRGLDKSLSGLIRLIKKIRTEKYDEIYSPHRSFRSAIIVLFSDVRLTHGFSNSSFPFVYKNVIEYSRSDHEVKRNLALAGFKTSNNDWKILPEITIPDRSAERINALLNCRGVQDNEKFYAAVAPGSVWETKKYPKQYYQELIKYLIDRDFTVLLIGGPADKKYCNELAKNFEKSVINTAGDFSIIESIEIIRHCKLLISNDSAPTHFGMCANVPVLTIYCSTIPEFGFYPYEAKSKFISFNDLECKPCGIHGYKACPLNHFACAHKINFEEIKYTIDKMLNNE